MAYLHPNSCECLLNNLDLFSVAPVQLSIEKTKLVEYRPVATIAPNQVIDFIVPPSSDYIDLSQTMIYVKGKIVKSTDGSSYAAAVEKEMTPINNFLHTLFAQVDITINGKLATGTNDHYAYKAYLRNVLSYGYEAKKTQLESSLWAPVSTRQARIKGSKEFEMIGRVSHDLVNQSRLILNNTELKFRFVPHRPEFYMYLSAAGVTAEHKPTFVPTEVALYVRKVTPAPSILLAHARTLSETSSAKYPFRKTDFKTHTLVQGTRNATIDNIFQGDVPSRVTIALVKHEAFNGVYANDPFYFDHFKLSSLTLSINGVTHNSKPLVCDFDNDNYVRAYMSLYEGLGIQYHNTGVDISFAEYKSHGKTLFVFDLTPDSNSNDESHVSLVTNGIVRVDLQFAADLAQNVTVIFYGEKEALMEIDEKRNVIATE